MTSLRFFRFNDSENITDLNHPLDNAVDILNKGLVLGVQSSSGFQLLAKAYNPDAVITLRQRKNTPLPLPLLYHELFFLTEDLEVDAADMLALQSKENNIVLLTRKSAPFSPIDFDALAPGLSRVGALLPKGLILSTLMAKCAFPVVITSGNKHKQATIYEFEEAKLGLAPLADALLYSSDNIERKAPPRVLLHSPMNRIQVQLHPDEEQNHVQQLLQLHKAHSPELKSLGVHWDTNGISLFRIDNNRLIELHAEPEWQTLIKDATLLLLGIQQEAYPNEGLLKLEAAAHDYFRFNFPKRSLSFLNTPGVPLKNTPKLILESIAKCKSENHEVPLIAARFHLTIADFIGQQAAQHQVKKILISGRYFKNAWLLDLTQRLLTPSYTVCS